MRTAVNSASWLGEREEVAVLGPPCAASVPGIAYRAKRQGIDLQGEEEGARLFDVHVCDLHESSLVRSSSKNRVGRMGRA
eukprot:3257530-Rhodomonas_salina.1